MTNARTLVLGALPAAFAVLAAVACAGPPLPPDVRPLELEGDLASRMVDGVDAFLLGELDRAAARRNAAWTPGDAGRDAMLADHRARLAHILGVRDPRVPVAVEFIATTARPSLVATGEGYRIHAVRWPALDGIAAEGLLLVPDGDARADVIALPDADQTPEQIAGVVPGVPAERQFARLLAENGCRVLVPTLISRRREPRNGRAVLSNREFIYRSAFELGRHVIGYEVQKILAAVDFFEQDHGGRALPIGVAGYGEGGLLALYAAALDERIDAALVSGSFDERKGIWRQPIDRNVFGLLERFGDAELAALVAPRPLVIDAAKGPEVSYPGEGGAPATLESPPIDRVQREFERARSLVVQLGGNGDALMLIGADGGDDPSRDARAVARFLKAIGLPGTALRAAAPPVAAGPLPDAEARQRRQLAAMDRFNQRLLEESPYVRAEFMKRLDTTSIAAYEKSVEPYREIFRNEIIGRFDRPLSEPRPRARKIYERPKWTGHEVVLDVFDGEKPEETVFLSGVLLVPNDVQPGERRPVVVCQHGLEGRPKDTIEGDHHAYHDYAAKLAERGFVVFAPQHLYLFGDRFRTLQRKANPLGKTLFSVMVPQHEQLLKWLRTLPFVDGGRVGFYGLSYGGKSAMRIPPLVDGYALSICSADFNDWVWKCASTRSPYSYVWTSEYEIFEFDLGSTFNYSEMAALIAPRPFMVERGHFDNVAPDERVAYEYAKVRRLYSAGLKVPDRTAIEFFDGPHTIHGEGTFRFLHRHLNHPAPE